jgi:hypothetical protein
VNKVKRIADQFMDTRKLYRDYCSAHGVYKRSQETKWRLHQYHLQNIMKADSEIVA